MSRIGAFTWPCILAMICDQLTSDSGAILPSRSTVPHRPIAHEFVPLHMIECMVCSGLQSLIRPRANGSRIVRLQDHTVHVCKYLRARTRRIPGIVETDAISHSLKVSCRSKLR